LFWVKCSGSGDVLVNSFGAIYEVDVKDGYTVDTGHIVAFEDTLQFKIGKAGQSLIGSMLGGEGLCASSAVPASSTARPTTTLLRRHPGGAAQTTQELRSTTMALQFDISGRPDFALLKVSLKPGDKVHAEPSAMASMDAHVKMKTGMKGVC